MNGFDMIKNAIEKSGKFEMTMEGEVNNEIGDDEIGIFKKGYGMIFKKKKVVEHVKVDEKKAKELVDAVAASSNKTMKKVAEEIKSTVQIIDENTVSIEGTVTVDEEDKMVRISVGKGVIEVFTPELLDYFEDCKDGDKIEVTFKRIIK